MNQSIKLSKAISYVVIILAALVFLAIWPGEFIQQKYVSKSNEIIAMESDPVNVERNVTQMFVGEGGELSAVDLYVFNDMRGETITFRLYDATYTEIFNTFYVVKENQEFPGFVHIPVGYDLIKDQEYYFTLEGLTADMTVAYEERETSTSIVNGFMSYGGIELQRYNVIIRYEYSNPFVWWQIVLLGSTIAALTSGLCILIHMLFSKKITDRDVKVHTVVRVVLNPIIVTVGLVLLLMIFPGRKFGREMLDYVFCFGGILLLVIELLFIVNFKREGKQSLIDVGVLRKHLPEYMQSICIAAVIWYCYEYMNGLYEIHHSLAVRRMLIWFFLGLLCTYSKKELFRVWNLGFLAVVGIASYFYAKSYQRIEEKGELRQLEACLFIIGGFVIWLLIINLIRFFMKKESVSNKLSIPYALGFAALLGSMIAFRNGREWLIAMAVIFSIFYLRMWLWNKNDRIQLIVANGMSLNFIYMVIYSLMHRPYHRYIFGRYGLGFHTVTMTGIYLALILSFIVVKFLNKYYEKKKLICTWPELILLSIANAYLFMTLSRTGFLAAVTVEIFAVVVFAWKKSDNMKIAIVKHIGVILVAVIIMFPTVYSMTRIVPAMANDPILSDVELTGYHITKGTPTNSKLYMKVEKFFEMAGVKLVKAHEDARIFLAPGDVFVVDDQTLLATVDDDIEVNSSINNLSNGRIDIFKAYIENWNMFGHEDMAVTRSDGTIIVHAHNVFLQVIHDHGLAAGFLFIAFGIASFVLAMIRFVKRGDISYVLTITVILSFALSGLVEWNFHLCQPFGIALFMVLTPLLFKNKDIKGNE